MGKKLPKQTYLAVMADLKNTSLSCRAIAQKHGVSKDFVHTLKNESHSKRTSDAISENDIIASDPVVRSDALSFVQTKKQKSFTTVQLANRLHCSIVSAKTVIHHLIHHDGYNILVVGKDEWRLVTELPTMKALELSRLLGKEHSFGLISDTHLCHETERLDVLHAAYKLFAKRNIKDVLHAGNIIEGEAPWNMYEIKKHGVHNQAQYLADNYPKQAGITTFFVTGECHEGRYQQKTGLRVGWYIQKVCEDAGRTDIKFVGHVERDIVLKQQIGETRIRVMHPGGGCAYALSYPGQKMVESFQGGEKPQVLILGHYHKFDVNYAREVFTVMPGCICDQSKFMRKHKLAAHVGFSILKIGSRLDGSVGRCSIEWFPFYDRKYHTTLNGYKLGE